MIKSIQNRTDLEELEISKKIDRICDSFEREWKSGNQPRIEEFLVETEEPVRTLLLDELEKLDRDYRSKVLPQKISRFEVEQLLGEGGHGRVYLAVDPWLNRKVAIKLPQVGTLAGQKSFLAEAKKLVSLDHPNIVPVYESGITDEGVPFVVSKYIDGEDLSVHLKKRSISSDTAIRMLHKIAEAVSFIHERNVIHRDIKPSNILVDRDGTPYLADFGIAKDLESTATMTSDGNIRGTLAYMSPEQAQGDSKDIDEQSDIYSLGIVLYEILCGKTPFKGSMYSVLGQIKNKLPVEPRKVNPDIPRNMEAICMTATAKEPLRRYDTAKDFAEDLNNAIEGRPVRARKLGYFEKSLWFVKRNPVIAALLLLLVGSFATFGIMMGFSGGVPEPNELLMTVSITTNPPGAKIVFVRLDETQGLPIEGESFQPSGVAPVEVELKPGLYWIEAELEDHGFQEVFRTVPADSEDVAGGYKHMKWTAKDDGSVELPMIVIPRIEDVEKNLVLIPGGVANYGTPTKTENVLPFLIARKEVSIREYRKSGIRFPEVVRSDDNTNNPMNNVSWDDAVAYAEGVGMRLPSLMEFVYAVTHLGSDSTITGLNSGVMEWTNSWGLPRPFDMSLIPAKYHTMLPHSRAVAGRRANWIQTSPYLEMKTEILSNLGFRCTRSIQPRFLNQD